MTWAGQSARGLVLIHQSTGKEENGKGAFYGPLLGPRKKAPIKFRNPDNPDETWSGRGKQPVWMREYLAEGKSIKNLEVAALGGEVGNG